MNCKMHARMMLSLLAAMATMGTQAALYLIPEYEYDTTKENPHWCAYSPTADGSYKEVTDAPALWCDGIFSMGDIELDGSSVSNPRNPEKAYRYQYRKSKTGDDGSVVHGGIWQGPVTGYCFLPADKYVWYIHLNLDLKENEEFKFRISEARSLSDTYGRAGYDVIDGNGGSNKDALREIKPFETCKVARGINVENDGGGFTSKENIDENVPYFTIKAPAGGLKGFYTLTIDKSALKDITDSNFDSYTDHATITLAPSLFATGSPKFADATGSSYGNYYSNATDNPTAEFIYDEDGKYKLLIFLEKTETETESSGGWIGFNISPSFNNHSEQDDQFWLNALYFKGYRKEGERENLYENFTIYDDTDDTTRANTTYARCTSDENVESGIQLRWGDVTGYCTVELDLDESKNVKSLIVKKGNTLQKVTRGYQPPRIYINDKLTTLQFDRGYNCWIHEFTAPSDGSDVTFRRRPFWAGKPADELANTVLTDSEHDGRQLIAGRTYQMILDNATVDRSITCREMPVYITGYTKTFGTNPDDETGWNSNTEGEFIQIGDVEHNGIYYFPVRFMKSCEFGISKKKGVYWENFDDGRAYNETSATLKEDGKSMLMEVPFGEWVDYEGFGAPKGQNFNWKFIDEENSETESWYIVVVDVNTKKVSVRRPGLSAVISNFRILPMEEDESLRNETDIFTGDNQPYGAFVENTGNDGGKVLTITAPVRYTRLNHIVCDLSFDTEYQLEPTFWSELTEVSVNGKKIDGVTVAGGTIDFITYNPDDRYVFNIKSVLHYPTTESSGSEAQEGGVAKDEYEYNEVENLNWIPDAPGVRAASDGIYIYMDESGSYTPDNGTPHHCDGEVLAGFSVQQSYDRDLNVYSGFKVVSRTANTTQSGSDRPEYQGYVIPGDAQKITIGKLDGYEKYSDGSYAEKHDWSNLVLDKGEMPLHIGYITASGGVAAREATKVGVDFYAHYPILCSKAGAVFTPKAAPAEKESGANVRRRAGDTASQPDYAEYSIVRADGKTPFEFNFTRGGLITGVDNVTAENPGESILYDLNGRQVDCKALRPGIYVRLTDGNAEKIMVK